MNKMTNEQMTDTELAKYYSSTHDLSEFDGGEVVTPPQGHSETRSVTISVRFSPSEVAEIEGLASAAGMRLTAFIRAAALASQEPPVDRAEVLDLLAAVRRSVEGPEPQRLSRPRKSVNSSLQRSAASGRYVRKPAGMTNVRTAAKAGRTVVAKASRTPVSKTKRAEGKPKK